jgi:hypothetical protein
LNFSIASGNVSTVSSVIRTGVGTNRCAINGFEATVGGEAWQRRRVTHDLLTVVERRCNELHTDVCVTALGPCRVADQNVDLIVLESFEPLCSRESTELHSLGITENGCCNRTAVVSIETCGGTVCQGLRETDSGTRDTTDELPTSDDSCKGAFTFCLSASAVAAVVVVASSPSLELLHAAATRARIAKSTASRFSML